MWSHGTAVPRFLRADQRASAERVGGETSVFYLPSAIQSISVSQFPPSPFDTPVTEDVVRWLEELRHETADTPGELVRFPYPETTQEQSVGPSRSNYNPWAYEDQRRSTEISRQLEEFIESLVGRDQINLELPEDTPQELNLSCEPVSDCKADEHIQIWEGLKVPRVFGLNSTPSLNTRLSAEANLSGTALSEDGLIHQTMDSTWCHTLPPTTRGKDRPELVHPASCPASPQRSTGSPHLTALPQHSPASLSAVSSGSSASSGKNLLNAANNYNVPQTSSPQVHMHSPELSLACQGTQFTPRAPIAIVDTVSNESPEPNKKYENIMNNLDAIISKFEEIKEKIRLKETDSSPNSAEDRSSLKDSELMKMCETAEQIIEETLSREEAREKKPRRGEMAPTTSTSSDASDDVFLNDSRGTDRARDIDRIFDQDNIPRTQPPEPPKRKKKANNTLSESLQPSVASRCPLLGPVEVVAQKGHVTQQPPKITEDKSTYVAEKPLTSFKSPTEGPDLKEAIKNAREIIDNCQMICLREMQPDINKMFEAHTSSQSKHSSNPGVKPVSKQSFKYSAKATDPLPSPPPSPPAVPLSITPLPTPPPSPTTSPTRDDDPRSNDLKIHLTPTKTISSLTFPANDDHLNVPDSKTVLRVMGPCPLAPPVPTQRSPATRVESATTQEVPHGQHSSRVKVDCPMVPEVPKGQRFVGARVECPMAPEVLTGQRSVTARVECPNAPEVQFAQRFVGARVECPMAPEVSTGQRSVTARVECPNAPEVQFAQRFVGARVECPMAPEVSTGQRSVTARVECPNAPEVQFAQRSIRVKAECPMAAEVPNGQRSAMTRVECPVPPETPPNIVETRFRKGSNASDVLAWKQTLQARGTNTFSYHDEEFHPHSMLSHEWFSSSPVQDCSQSGTLSGSVDSWIQPENSSLLGSPSGETGTGPDKLSVATITKLIEAELRGKQHPRRTDKVKSLISKTVGFGTGEDQKDGVPYASSDLWNESTAIVREGILNRSKITENGKKIRKNWTSSYAVLTETFLLFFKDVKSFNAMKIGKEPFRPDLILDLSSTMVERDEKLTSRKNVLVVGSAQGLQILMQTPSPALTDQWLASIKTANSQVCGNVNSPRSKPRKESAQESVCSASAGNSPSAVSTTSTPSDDSNRGGRTGTVWPVHVSPTTESIEDLTASVEERQTNTKARLKKFFHKRPSKESLVKKGIYKDEPMFGCSLSNVVSVDTHPCVPRFVVNCIQAIECKDENMKADGLYRASGNLSHVQKIRLQVDQNRLSVLDEEEDVHVLTGVLKLFFRELKKPLIPFEMFHKAISASGIADRKERVRQFRALIRSLPLPNHDTLAYLLEHLVRVTKKKDYNRMHIPNIAIVFGPTLMWPEEESLNMALDLMKQNLVIESLLVDYDDIFR